MGQAKIRRELGLGPREEKIAGNTPSGRRGWIARLVSIPPATYQVHRDGSVYEKKPGAPLRRVKDRATLELVEERYRKLYGKPEPAPQPR